MVRCTGRRLLGAIAAVAVAVLLAEGAVRLRQIWRYGTTRGYHQFVHDPASGLAVPVAGQELGPISINSLGFRGPEIEVPKPPGRLRIAFLGGSTTFGAEASAGDRTWPALVAAGLREAFPGLDVDYVNGGTGGYTAIQSLANLRHRIAPLDPDLVVVYHGTNDLTHDSRALAVEAGLHEPGANEPSALARVSVAWELVEKNLRWALRPPRSHPKLELDPEAVAAPFRARLAELVAAARETDGEAVLVTFATQPRRSQPPERLAEASRSALYYMPWLEPEDFVAGIEALNAVVRDVAGKTGAILVEEEDSIPADARHFADSVHFLDPGHRAQAERVLRALRASGSFRALVEDRRRAGRGS